MKVLMSLTACLFSIGALATHQPAQDTSQQIAKIITPSATANPLDDDKSVVEDFYQAFQTNDSKRLGELLSTNYGVSNASDLQDSAYSRYTELSKNMKVRAAAMKRAMPDFTIHIDELLAEGQKVFATVRLTGVQKGDFLGVAPTQKPITMKGYVVFTVKQGKIVHINEMWNEYSIMKQLGFIVL